MTLVLVIPGFVFQGARIRLRGRTPGDTQVATRVLSAIAVSAIFALLYVAVLGPTVTGPGEVQEELFRHPQRYALLGLALAFVVPTVAAYVFALVLSTNIAEDVRTRLFSSRWTRIDPRPSAWDAAFGDIGECFVRVRTRDRVWYAGWFGTESYASSWPDPQTLYVQIAYQVDENGAIGAAVNGSDGAFIDCTDVDYIEFLVSPDQVPSGIIEDTEVPDE